MHIAYSLTAPSIFSTIYTLIALFVVYPYFGNEKKYMYLLLFSALFFDIVYTSTILDTNVSIPYETPDFVPTDEDSILINLGKPLESLPIVDEYNDPYTEFEKEINEFLSSLSYPIDASEKTKFCLAKNQIINYIRTKYPGYDILCSMINDTTIAIMATSEGVSGSWFKRTKVTYTNSYLIAMKLDGTAYFKECK